VNRVKVFTIGSLIIPSKVICDFSPKVRKNEKEGKQRQEEREFQVRSRRE